MSFLGPLVGEHMLPYHYCFSQLFPETDPRSSEVSLGSLLLWMRRGRYLVAFDVTRACLYLVIEMLVIASVTPSKACNRDRTTVKDVGVILWHDDYLLSVLYSLDFSKPLDYQDIPIR